MLHNFLRKLDGDPDICVRLLAGERECGRTRAEHTRPWRESRITGERLLDDGMSLGLNDSVALHDAAEAVPVHDQFSYAAMVTWIDPASGRRMVRMRYCGPAAPLPRAYRERADWGAAGRTAFEIEERDERRVYTWRQLIDDEQVAHLTVPQIWHLLRHRYAAREDRP